MAKLKLLPNLNSGEVELIKKIKSLRISKGLTQVELAKMAGLTQAYIAQIEGFERNPSFETISKIANAIEDKSIIDFYKQIDSYQKKKSNIINKLPVSDFMLFNEDEVIRLNNVKERTVFLPEKTIDYVNKFDNKLFYSYFMKDDSMEPEIKKDSNLIIQFVKEINPIDYIDKLNGSFVVIVKPDCDTLIRKFVVYDKDTVIFQAVNPNYEYYKIKRNNGYSEYKVDTENNKSYNVQIFPDDTLYIVGLPIFAIEERKVGNFII
jgi:transcriptional regulator with XRE-family HTH domain